MFRLIGVCSLDNSIFEIYRMGGFGSVGCVFKKLAQNPPP